jgi:CRP-like cAMP-binding protein
MDILSQLSELGARVECCRSKQPVIVRGEILNDFYVVKRGCAIAQYKSRGRLCSFPLEPGDFFGERALLLGEASDMTVRPIGEATDIMAVPIECARRLLEERPDVKKHFLDRVAARQISLRLNARMN